MHICMLCYFNGRLWHLTVLLFSPSMLALLEFLTIHEATRGQEGFSLNCKCQSIPLSVKTSSVPTSSRQSSAEASLKLALVSFLWFWGGDPSSENKPWLVQMLIEEENLRQRQKKKEKKKKIISEKRHLDFIWIKERREVWSWFLPLALPLFFISSTWIRFPSPHPSICSIYTKSLQNITVQLYTENIPQ